MMLPNHRHTAITVIFLLLLLVLAGCNSLPVSDHSYPPLWVIEDPDSSGKVWLYGTVHVLPYGKSPSIKFVQRRGPSRLPLPLSKPEWVSGTLNKVLRRIDLLVMELDYSREPKKLSNHKSVTKTDSYNLNNHNLTPLFSYLSESEKQYVIKAANQRGLPITDLEKLSAPSALFMFSILPRRDTGLDQLGGVEDWLLSYTRIKRTPLAGLETPALRLEAIAAALQSVEPEQQHQIVLDYLGSSIEEAEAPELELQELYQLWRSGELEQLEQQRAAFAEFYPEIYEAFLGYRNRAWIASIIEHINSNKDVLIAVGQGHLIGPENIRELLSAQGFQITRLQ